MKISRWTKKGDQFRGFRKAAVASHREDALIIMDENGAATWLQMDKPTDCIELITGALQSMIRFPMLSGPLLEPAFLDRYSQMMGEIARYYRILTAAAKSLAEDEPAPEKPPKAEKEPEA